MAADNKQRRRRLDGEDSRRRILEAAGRVASERGYDGTSISLVSKACGLPNSSIFWHFKDKDDLIASVIESSFADWMSVFTVPEGDTALEQILTLCQETAKSLLEEPDFLRLGLMLALERRPEEPRARAMFMEIRRGAFERFTEVIREFAPQLSDNSVQLVTKYGVAAADGLFMAGQMDGDRTDLYALFEMHARAVHYTLMRLIEEETS
ncbi:TetR/AcrR family transcriptional regulator [Antrihabitans sp. YC2-6]|uniref:TetR/AcrR family transcriptional regulator n=1 Tax=Antrihabitans sp. YC2-6 TaxID=2799498 RepID=UPI0018F5F9FC|nr:TetR/AcrR family transcriptional regulator [Antrihabitans sp. YC2-6]MBJ8347239.1 TetR/AcrR family transcriptional regulator [Antrihabitans sp. YC2-6]